MYLRNNLNVPKQGQQARQETGAASSAAGNSAAAGIGVQSAQQAVNNFVGSNIDYLL